MEREYRAGDLLNLTCVSAPSNPPSRLKWNLNGRSLDPAYVSESYLLEAGEGLFSSFISLLMPLEPRHFDESPDGKVRAQVVCPALGESASNPCLR